MFPHSVQFFYHKTVHSEVNPLSFGDVGRRQKKQRDREPEASDLQTFLGNYEDNFLNDDVHPIKTSSPSVTELVDMGAFPTTELRVCFGRAPIFS